MICVTWHSIRFLIWPFICEYLINSELKGIVEHSWNELTKQLTRTLKARILIDFNEPHFHFLINDEIQTEDFETEFPMILIDFLVD
jgi:hypothetical protein